jgi:hypothetical protein
MLFVLQKSYKTLKREFLTFDPSKIMYLKITPPVKARYD